MKRDGKHVSDASTWEKRSVQYTLKVQQRKSTMKHYKLSFSKAQSLNNSWLLSGYSSVVKCVDVHHILQ